MSETAVLTAPEISWPTPSPDKWDEEHQAFVAQRGDLLRRFPGEYVAIHDGRVVGHGPDKIAVALQAYREHGRVAIYVGLLSESPPAPARQPTFRTFAGDATR